MTRKKVNYSKKINLKKRLKRFTSFYHATNLKNKILNIKILILSIIMRKLPH